MTNSVNYLDKKSLNKPLIKAIIFDMDGVLIDTFEAHFHAWQKFMKHKGISKFERRNYLESIGMQTRELLLKYKNSFGLNTENIEKDTLLKESMIDISEISLYPHVKETLDILKNNGFKLALATSAIGVDLKDRVERYNFNENFDAFVCSDEVKFSKPHPEIFLKAAKKLKISLDKCVVIEDAITGIIAAKKAGMKAIALTTTFPKHKFEEMDKQFKPDLILNDIAELPKAIPLLNC